MQQDNMISIEYEQRHVNKQFKKQKIFFVCQQNWA